MAVAGCTSCQSQSPRTIASAERFQARSRQSSEGKLTLRTAEGDEVTISFRNVEKSRVNQRGVYSQHGSYQSARSRYQEQTQLSVSLKGSLSPEELKDIEQLVAKLGSALQSTISGDSEAAQEQIASVADLSTIQSFGFAYREQTQSSFRGRTFSLAA